MSNELKPINILYIEDSPGDARLVQEALKEGKLHNNLFIVRDGIEAMAYLHTENKYALEVRPDLILLDLNLPKMDGREVLKAIKADDNLKKIPVVILTTSTADEDILKSYNHHANCFITKPIEFNQFIKVVKSIENFWFTIVKLPPNEGK